MQKWHFAHYGAPCDTAGLSHHYWYQICPQIFRKATLFPETICNDNSASFSYISSHDQEDFQSHLLLVH